MFPKQEGPKVQKWAFLFWRVYCGFHPTLKYFVSMNSLGKSLSEKLQHYYYATMTIFDIGRPKVVNFKI
jgi:hypothetical protein